MSLVNSSFAVNVTPGAMPPTVHVSEYDIGRTYTVTINGENGSAFNIPTGTTATVEGTLNGAIGFTTDATISGSTVSFTLTESMTAKSGKAWCKIKLTLNDESIQTRAFVLAVDRAGVEAETVIGADGFDTQIQNAVDNYLDEHPVGVEVDPTLTISGAAADAKVTGDKIGDLKSALKLDIDGLDNGKRYMQFMRGNISPTGAIDLTFTTRIVTAEYEKFATATDVIFSAGFGYIVAFYNDDYSLASRTLYSGANTITFPANTFYRVCVYGNEAGPDDVADWADKVYWVSEIQKKISAIGYSNSASLDITNYVKRFENLGIKQGELVKIDITITAVGSGAKNVQIFANTISEANLIHTFYETSGFFFNASADIDTIIVLLNTAGSLTSVDVTTNLQTGYFILASETRHTYRVEKDGTGDFTSLVEAIKIATQSLDSVVYVGAGTWDIIDELGETYLNNVSAAPGMSGPYLKNRVHLIFASNSKVVCNYPGSREETIRNLSPFNAGELGFTLENANIEASNVRYCVHDERSIFSDAYVNKYINCKMHLNNSGNTVIRTCNPIGGGLGKDGYVEIDGCWFKGERTIFYTENLPLVTYHNSASAEAKSHISLKNSYFADDGRPRFNWYGQSQLITDVEVCGCSMGSPILSQAETSDGSSPYQNISIIEWNNTVRT